MQIYARDHAEVHPQKKKVLYLVKKKKKKQEQRNIVDINCEVLYARIPQTSTFHL